MFPNVKLCTFFVLESIILISINDSLLSPYSLELSELGSPDRSEMFWSPSLLSSAPNIPADAVTSLSSPMLALSASYYSMECIRFKLLSGVKLLWPRLWRPDLLNASCPDLLVGSLIPLLDGSRPDWLVGSLTGLLEVWRTDLLFGLFPDLQLGS